MVDPNPEKHKADIKDLLVKFAATYAQAKIAGREAQATEALDVTADGIYSLAFGEFNG